MKNLTHIVARYAASTMMRGPFAMAADQAGEYEALSSLGISFDSRDIAAMTAAMDAFAPTPTIGAGTITNPSQFLQTWLPGLVRTITQARVIDELIGMSVGGDWADEEVIQQVLEPTGSALPYTDHGNVPLASWNPSFERRTVVRFEQGFEVGRLEEDRTSRVPNFNTAAEKRMSAALSLEILRNRIGFYGYYNGTNRTFGILNDPNLPAYVTVANPGGGTTWATKTFLQITADLRAAMGALRTSSGATIDPARTSLVLGIASNAVDYLTVTSDFGVSVSQWMAATYPRVRVVPVPEFNAANGGANVFYLFADRVEDGSSDGGEVFAQIVPAKLRSLGVEQRVKTYLEDYTNATAGVMLKRPFALVRRSGI